MSVSPYTSAQKVAASISSQLLQMQSQTTVSVSKLNDLLANGVAANGNNAAVAAADIQAALPNLAEVQAKIAAFSTAASA